MIDVVVVAYRSADVLPGCIESLRAEGLVNKFFIVDNSPDQPLGVEEGSDIVVLRPGRNLGFGSGVNLARPHITTTHVAIVNPDLRVTSETLGPCTKFLDDNEHVALVSPRVYVGGSLARISEHEVSLPRYLAHIVSTDPRHGIPRSIEAHSSTHSTEALNGAFMVAKVDALEAVDWFDESIFLFGEETDLCRRLRKRGYQIVYLAAGGVDHLDGHSSAAASLDIRKLRRDARVEQLRRARGPVQAMLYSALVQTRALRRRRRKPLQ